MARLLLGLLGLLLVALMPSSALAHEAARPGRADDTELEEARQLTEGLRISAASPSKARGVRAPLAEQAKRRGELLARIAECDPHAALDLALAPHERAALPPDVQAATEEWTQLDGYLEVIHIDDENGSGTYEAKLVKNGGELKLRPGNGLGARPGDEVRVTGVRLPADGSVVTDQVTAQRAGPGVGPTGPQRTAIVTASPVGSAAHRYSDKAAVASMFFSTTSGRSARAWYDEASYGQTTIVGGSGAEGTTADVFGPYALPSASCGTSTIRNEAFAAADPELNFNAYDRVVILWDYAACGNGGVGTVRTSSVGTFDGAPQHVSVSWVFNQAFGTPGFNNRIGGVAVHEYGHNLGVWHANVLECGALPINGASCSSDEYGDPADVMGSSGGLGHFNGLHKDTLGWLGGRSQVVAATGTYTLTAYEEPSATVKSLKLPRTRDGSGTVTSYYYLEYRKPTANWSGYLNARPTFGAGVLVHAGGALPMCSTVCGPDFYGPGGGGDSNLIDTTPASQPGTNDLLDAPLMPGQLYTDHSAGISVGVVATDGYSATVNVALMPPMPSVQSTVYPEDAGTVTGGGNVALGQNVTLIAVPNAGYSFLHWREARSTRASYSNPYTFTASADRHFEAVFSTVTAAPPANDHFGSAAVLATLPANVTVNTSAATTESGEPTTVSNPVCDTHNGSLGRTVWYRYTPTATTTMTISTAGSTFDTVVTVNTGPGLGGLTRIACNDDTPTTAQAQLTFTAAAGTTYYVQIGGYGGASGTLHAAFAGTQVGTDLAVVLRAAPDAQLAGTPLTLTGYVANDGQATANGVTFTLGLPAGATAVVPTTTLGTCAAGGSQVSCQLGTLTPGQRATIGVTLVPTAGSRAPLTAAVAASESDPNPSNNSATVTPIVRPTECRARPPVQVQTARTGDGRLQVTVTAGIGNVYALRFGSATNAVVHVGARTPASGNFTYDVPGGGPSATFYVQRAAGNSAVTVPLVVEDDCGTWETFVGGGAAAF